MQLDGSLEYKASVAQTQSLRDVDVFRCDINSSLGYCACRL